MKAKILITGASGFVGKNLISYLQNLTDIKSLGRSELASSIVFRDEEAIIHLAGKAHDLKKTGNPDDYYAINYELTKKLYDAFLSSNVKTFIFLSSVKASADSVTGILGEEAVPAPITHYGKSKLMAEQYIAAQVLPAGKNYYILRPCMIHGPGNKGNLNLLYQFVQKGIPYPLAAFQNNRSFLSINNLCFIMLSLVAQRPASGIYNVADDESLSTNQVVSILAKAMDKQPRLIALPKKLIRALAKLGDRLGLPFNTERLDKLTENYLVSNAKIKLALKTELPISATDGLKITAASFASK